MPCQFRLPRQALWESKLPVTNPSDLVEFLKQDTLFNPFTCQMRIVRARGDKWLAKGPTKSRIIYYTTGLLGVTVFSPLISHFKDTFKVLPHVNCVVCKAKTLPEISWLNSFSPVVLAQRYLLFFTGKIPFSDWKGLGGQAENSLSN